MKKYIGVKELSEYLSIKPSTIYHWTHEQRIPHYKVSGLIRFNIEQIDRWMARKKQKEVNIKELVDSLPMR